MLKKGTTTVAKEGQTPFEDGRLGEWNVGIKTVPGNGK